MLEVFRNPAYDFIGWRHWAYGVSAALMLLGLGFPGRRGHDRKRGARRADLPRCAIAGEPGILAFGLAGLLTVIGFSVNDRIVMYDRLREIRSKKMAKGTTFAQQVNLAVNQTLSRTVLTVATVAMSGAALFFFGGASLEGFAFVVLVGSLTGTSSTVYVAAALDVDWSAWLERRRGARIGAGARVGHGTRR
jgi:hypothetical protein